MVAEAHTAVEHEQKGIVYVRIPGHDKTEPIDVDVEKPLGDVRDTLKRFTQFAFDGNFRLKDSHDVLDASKSLRDLGLDCGVGQYVELEYHHPNHFPGLLGGGSWTDKKRALAKDCEKAGVNLQQKGLNGKSSLDDFRKALAVAQGDADAEPASLASRRVARTASKPQQSEETKEEDVEMEEVTLIKLGNVKDEKLLYTKVEKLLHEAGEAWTCAKIKFHDAVIDLHTINASPARSMAWLCRSLALLET